MGRHILATVVEKRLGKLGDTHKNLFQPDALELLCEKSGGVLRDLVRLARTAGEVALRKKMNQVNLALAQDAIREDRKDYTIADYQFPELDTVHRTGQLTTNSFDSPRHGFSGAGHFRGRASQIEPWQLAQTGGTRRLGGRAKG